MRSTWTPVTVTEGERRGRQTQNLMSQQLKLVVLKRVWFGAWRRGQDSTYHSSPGHVMIMHVITPTDAEVKGEEDKGQDATLVDSTDIPESSDQVESDQPQEQQGQRGGGGVIIKRRNQAMYNDPSDDTTQ